MVRGPDLLWGGDVRSFRPPAGRFDGVIGGPPCQHWSSLAHLNKYLGRQPAPNLIPEYERCVSEARPAWFLMENVPEAPDPQVDDYTTYSTVLNNRWFYAEQNRERRFAFGWLGALRPAPWRHLDLSALEPSAWSHAVTCDMRHHTTGDRMRNAERVGTRGGVLPCNGQLMPFEEMCRLQGLPAEFLSDAPFTQKGKRKAVGNAVPLPMGRAVAKAVARWTEDNADA